MNGSACQLTTSAGSIAVIDDPRTGSITSEVRGWLRKSAGRVRLYRQRTRAIQDMRRMSNWQLSDLGIDRSQIPMIVAGLMAQR